MSSDPRSPESRQANAEALGAQLSRRVKELRSERNWSLDALSAACGVSRSMLSQIERDQANPTLAVTLKIAQAFGMSLGELVDTPELAPKIHVIRAEDRQFQFRSGDVQIRTLSPLHLEKDVEFYEVRIRPGHKMESAPHFQNTREFLTVESGNVSLASGDETCELSRGDSASYRADVPHCIANSGEGDAVIFLVVSYR